MSARQKRPSRSRTLTRFSLLLALCLAGGAARSDTQDRLGFNIPGLVIVWAADDAGGTPKVLDFVLDTASGTGADTDLIADDAFTVVTGTLTPAFGSSDSDDVPSRVFEIYNSPDGNGSTDSNGNGVSDAGDQFGAFALSNRTNVGLRDSVATTSFYVASNTSFNIDAQAIRVVGRNDWVLGKIFWDMTVTVQGDDGLAFGSRAQFPHSDGEDGGVAAVANLLEMKNRQTVFMGNQPTAQDRGTIAQQSVRFDVVYTLGSWRGYTLSTPGTQMADGIYEVEAEVTYTVWVP